MKIPTQKWESTHFSLQSCLSLLLFSLEMRRKRKRGSDLHHQSWKRNQREKGTSRLLFI